MLDFIARPLGMLLKLVFDFVGDYGYSLIIFTVITKIILLPINIKQTESTKRMNEITPKMKEIQEKYKNDKAKANEKLLELYKEHNYNPASGCLPLLIQMPILFALFYVIQQPVKYVFLNQALFDSINKSFWWLPNLSNADPFYILPILSAVTTYIQTKMISVKSNNDPTQRTMTTMMPLMMGWISLNLPSGLVLYWVVGNIFTIVQQYFMIKPVRVGKEES